VQHISARNSNVLQFSVWIANNITATYISLVVSCKFTCAASVPTGIGLIFMRLSFIQKKIMTVIIIIVTTVRFSAPVQTDPGAHPASYTMDIGSFPRVKRPEYGVDYPPPSSAEVKERVEL